MKELNINGKKFSLEKPIIMGILNVTPDSFSDGGEFIDVEKAVMHAKQMIKDGADIIDVGGESSRPGSLPVSEAEELNRVKPVISRLVKEVDVPISIDTYKASVAEECVKLGASIINDISGAQDDMRAVASKYKVAIVIMHMLGTPKTMQQDISYDDVVSDVKSFLKERVLKARKAGITDIIIDPGIGFGKTTEQNLEIIRRLDEFKDLGCPILIGASRKSFIGKVLDVRDPNDRLIGTITSSIIAVQNGANILRVHDVKECMEAIKILDAINGFECKEDKIIIKDASFLCNLGVTLEERKEKQEILVDIEIYSDVKKSSKSDKIADTINYSDVVKEVRKIVEEKEFKLIETVAQETADIVLRGFEVKKVKVVVKKPGAIKNTKYAAVSIVREK